MLLALYVEPTPLAHAATQASLVWAALAIVADGGGAANGASRRSTGWVEGWGSSGGGGARGRRPAEVGPDRAFAAACAHVLAHLLRLIDRTACLGRLPASREPPLSFLATLAVLQALGEHASGGGGGGGGGGSGGVPAWSHAMGALEASILLQQVQLAFAPPQLASLRMQQAHLPGRVAHPRTLAWLRAAP